MFGLNGNEKLCKGRGVVEFRLYRDSHVDYLTEKKRSERTSYLPLVPNYQTIRSYILDNSNLDLHRSGEVKFRMENIDQPTSVSLGVIPPVRQPCGTLKGRFKADSHLACRAHAVPLSCRALIHTCHAAPLPCSDSAVSFVNARMVAGNMRLLVQQCNRSSFCSVLLPFFFSSMTNGVW